MLFPTFPFFVFFLVAWSVYWLLRRNGLRLAWLLAASAIFYAHWNPRFLVLIALSTSVDYLVALRLPRTTHPGARRAFVALSVGVNLGILFLFKYGALAAETAGAAIRLLGSDLRVPVPSFVLPLGISFYTFEAISYVVDVSRGRLAPVRNPLRYALFILFFPHLVAGPIVRGGELLPQLASARRPDWRRFVVGLRLFLLGLVKKCVLADRLAAAADPVFASPESFGTAAVWLGVLAYAGQIYGDFSGYSDMAVGLAHTLGLKLPDNFRMPYLASDVAEFWRRWHITLSRWLRDYLYVPLGGSRHGEGRTRLNLLVTMLLGGLWHGAAWHFVAWGGYHGVLLVLHRAFFRGRPARLPRGVRVASTFFLVTVGWVLFRSPTLTDAVTVLSRMLVPAPGGGLPAEVAAATCALLLALALGHAVGARVDLSALLDRMPYAVQGSLLAATLLFVQLLTPASGLTFIYFQF